MTTAPYIRTSRSGRHRAYRGPGTLVTLYRHRPHRSAAMAAHRLRQRRVAAGLLAAVTVLVALACTAVQVLPVT